MHPTVVYFCLSLFYYLHLILLNLDNPELVCNINLDLLGYFSYLERFLFKELENFLLKFKKMNNFPIINNHYIYIEMLDSFVHITRQLIFLQIDNFKCKRNGRSIERISVIIFHILNFFSCHPW